MEVKLPNTKICIAVPAQYERALPLLQHVSHPAALLSPDDIIDCVELRTGKASPANKEIIKYRPSDGPQIKNKGQIVDTWV